MARNVAAVDTLVTMAVIERLLRRDARKLVQPKTGNGVSALRRELSAAEFAEDRTEHVERLQKLEARIAAAEEADIVAPLLSEPGGDMADTQPGPTPRGDRRW